MRQVNINVGGVEDRAQWVPAPAGLYLFSVFQAPRHETGGACEESLTPNTYPGLAGRGCSAAIWFLTEFPRNSKAKFLRNQLRGLRKVPILMPTG